MISAEMLKHELDPSPLIDPWEKLLKSSWEKETMAVTCIFAFFHPVFYPVEQNLMFWVTFKLSSANAPNLDKVNILSSGERDTEVR